MTPMTENERGKFLRETALLTAALILVAFGFVWFTSEEQQPCHFEIGDAVTVPGDDTPYVIIDGCTSGNVGIMRDARMVWVPTQILTKIETKKQDRIQKEN